MKKSPLLLIAFAGMLLSSFSCDLFNGSVNVTAGKKEYHPIQLVKPSETTLAIKDTAIISFLCDSSVTNVEIELRVGASGHYVKISPPGQTSGGRGIYSWAIDSIGAGSNRILPLDPSGSSNIRISDNFRSDSLSFDTCASPFSIIMR